MSLIAVVPDHECDLAVLYASEVHYLVDLRYSFVTLELALKPAESCDTMAIVLDGSPPSTGELQGLQQSANFRELVWMSQSDKYTPSDGIWDFRATFFQPHLVTNRGYEGPSDWKQIAVVKAGSEVRYVGQRARVPHWRMEFVLDPVESFLSMVALSGQVLDSGTIYLARLGFFLTRHPLKRRSWLRTWLDTQAGYRPRTTFFARFYSYSTTDQPALERLDVASRMQHSTLALTLAPFVNLAGQEFAPHAPVPTSDLWIVGYGPTAMSIRSPRIRLDEHSRPRPTGFALYPQQEEAVASPFWESHFIPKLHDPQLQGLDGIQPRANVPQDISWDGEVPGLTVRGFVHVFVRYVGILALVIALANVFFGSVGPNFAQQLTIASVVIYSLLVAAGAWARQHIPVIRRFFESRSSLPDVV